MYYVEEERKGEGWVRLYARRSLRKAELLAHYLRRFSRAKRIRVIDTRGLVHEYYLCLGLTRRAGERYPVA